MYIYIYIYIIIYMYYSEKQNKKGCFSPWTKGGPGVSRPEIQNGMDSHYGQSTNCEAGSHRV